MILETVDLHFPEGWSPKEYNKFNDLRDPIAYVDNRLANFVSQFKRIKMVTQKSNKDCFERLCSFEPFNNEVISSRIWEAVKDEQ